MTTIYGESLKSIHAGVKGQTGSQGPIGPTGEQGPQGPPGDPALISLTGDVFAATGNGVLTTTISPHAVTLSKLAPIPTSSFLGRFSSLTGDVEILNLTDAKILLGLSGSNTGDQIISLSGDVFSTNVSGTSCTTTISNNSITADKITNNAVTLPKLAQISSGYVLGRVSSGPGDVESIEASSTLKTMLNLSGSNTGDQTIQLIGDIYGSGLNTFTASIANNAVTLPKLLNVSSSTFLGRNSADTGNVEVLAVDTVKTMLTLTGTNTGDQTITLTGPITGSGTGTFSTSITDHAVSLPKLQVISATTILGNNTNATNAVSELSTTNVKDMLNLSGTNTGDQTIILSGDLIGSGTGSLTATIQANAITTDKIADANVTLPKIQTIAATTLLGNKTANTAAVTTLTIEDVKTMLNITGTNTGDQTITLFGDLSGTGTGSLTATIANNAITSAKIADLNVITSKIADLNVTTGKLADLGVTTGKLADISVTSGKLADFGVTTGKLADLSVSTSKLADLSVTTAKVADNNITTLKIADANVTLSKIQSIAATTLLGNKTANTAAVTNLSVADVKTMLNLTGTNTGDQTITLSGDLSGTGTGSLTATIANNAITSVKIANNAVTNEKILIKSVTFDKLPDITAGLVGRTGSNAGQIDVLPFAQVKPFLDLSGINSGDQTITLSGDLTGSSSGSLTATIQASAVTTTKIADGNVTLAKIANINGTTLLGNSTVTLGAVTALTTTDVKTMLNLAGTNSGDQTITLSGDLTGSSSGSLTATIQANAVTTTKIADANVTLAKIANINGTTILGNSSATSNPVSALSTSDVKTMLNLAGTNTGDQIISLSGDLTGSSSGSLTATIQANAVTSTKIADGAITNLKYAAKSITFDKLADIPAGLIGRTGSGFGQGNVYSFSEVKTFLDLSGVNSGDQTITLSGDLSGTGTGALPATIAANAVTTSKIANSNVTLAKIANINGTTILGNSLATSNVVSALSTSVVKTMLNLAGTNTGDQTITLSGDLTGSSSGSLTATIQANAITTTKIADLNVTTGKLADLSVTTGKLADLSVTTGKLVDGNVTTAKIANSNVTLDKIANIDGTTILGNSLATSNVVSALSTNVVKTMLNLAGTNTGDQIITLSGDLTGSSSGSLTATIQANAITTTKIADANVTLSKLQTITGSTFLGNKSATGAAVTTLTVSDVKTMLDLSGINTGDQMITLSGDLSGTGTGSLTATIASNAITSVKIANNNVTLAKLATVNPSTFLGRITSSVGNVEELSVANAKSLLGIQSSANYSQGSVLFANASGVISENNSNLYYDSTNTKLAIGKNFPSATLNVVNSTTVGQIVISSFDGSFTSTGDFSMPPFAMSAATDNGLTSTSSSLSPVFGSYTVTTASTPASGNEGWRIFGSGGDWISANTYTFYSGTSNYYIAGTTYQITSNNVTWNGDWVKIECPAKMILKYFRFQNRNSANRNDPRVFRMCGSNDNINWDTKYRHDTTDADYSGSNRLSDLFVIQSPAAYKYYLFQVYYVARFDASIGVTLQSLQLYALPETAPKLRVRNDNIIDVFPFDSTIGTVGIGTDSPDPSALLDISSSTKGLLPPRMTTTQKTSITASAGLTVYDSTMNIISFYNGSNWINLNQPTTLTGDVTGSGIGSITTSIPNSTIITSKIADKNVTFAKLPDVNTSTFLGKNTANTGSVEVLSLDTVKTMLSITGTNTGDQTITLTGPVTGTGNGTFATTITDNAITTSKISDDAIVTNKILNNNVTFQKLQTIDTTTFLGRNSANTGNVEILSLASAKAMLGLGPSFGNLTTGSIVFADSSGGFTQNNSNLFFDTANVEFGIGTNTPSAAINVKHAFTGSRRMAVSVDTKPNTSIEYKFPPFAMTANTSETPTTYVSPPFGIYTVSTSSTFSVSFPGWKAFDQLDTANDTWISSASFTSTVTGSIKQKLDFTSEWIKIECSNAQYLTGYRYRTRNSTSRGDPYVFQMSGSNNDSTYTVLHSFTGSNPQTQNTYYPSSTTTYTITTPAYYKFYKFEIFQIISEQSVSYCTINELELYTTPTTISAFRVRNDDVIDMFPYNSSSNGKIGIGTDTPTAKLHIFKTTDSGDAFRIDDVSPFIIDSLGEVGIGTISPTSRLHVRHTHTGSNSAFNVDSLNVTNIKIFPFNNTISAYTFEANSPGSDGSYTITTSASDSVNFEAWRMFNWTSSNTGWKSAATYATLTTSPRYTTGTNIPVISDLGITTYGHWFKIQCPLNTIIITDFQFQTISDSTNRGDPYYFTLFGSMDNSSWKSLYTLRSGTGASSGIRYNPSDTTYYSVANTTAYTYYMFQIHEITRTGSASYCGINRFIFLSNPTVLPYIQARSNNTVSLFPNTFSLGKVGIGTSTPYAKLHVITSNTSQNALTVYQSSTNAFVVNASGDVGVGLNISQAGYESSQSSNVNSKFSVYDIPQTNTTYLRLPPIDISLTNNVPSTTINDTQTQAPVELIGTYVMNVSSFLSTLINPFSYLSTAQWVSGNNFTTNAGTNLYNYVGASSLNVNGTTIYGEWIRLRLPTKVILRGFRFFFGTMNYPTIMRVVGTNDSGASPAYTLLKTFNSWPNFTANAYIPTDGTLYTPDSTTTAYDSFAFLVTQIYTTSSTERYSHILKILLFTSANDLATPNVPAIQTRTASNTNKLQIFPYNFDSNGNVQGKVGINTQDPQTALHVFKNGSNFILEGIDHSYMEFHPRGSSAGRKAWFGYGSGNTTSLSLWNADSGYLYFATNNLLAMTIDSARNVGIGTSSPTFKLDVNGETDSSKYATCAALPNSSTRPAVSTQTIPGEIHSYGSVTGTTLVTSADDGFLRISAGGGTSNTVKSFIDLSGFSTQADMNQNITFGTKNVERMRIDVSGNVGIGTTTPSAKLHVFQTNSNDSFRVDNDSLQTSPFVIDQSGSVGIGTATPNANAILDITTTTKGLLLPRLSTVQRNNITSTPGLMVYDTDIKSLCFGNGTNWEEPTFLKIRFNQVVQKTIGTLTARFFHYDSTVNNVVIPSTNWFLYSPGSGNSHLWIIKSAGYYLINCSAVGSLLASLGGEKWIFMELRYSVSPFNIIVSANGQIANAGDGGTNLGCMSFTTIQAFNANDTICLTFGSQQQDQAGFSSGELTMIKLRNL